jgi:hypothetical protein
MPIKKKKFLLVPYLLGIDDLKVVLKYYFAQRLHRHVAAFKHGQVQGIIGLLGYIKTHFKALADLSLVFRLAAR